jgi:signal transduction histidine kinase
MSKQTKVDRRSTPLTYRSLADKLDRLVRGLSEQVAVVNEAWVIVSVNEAWKRMVKVAGYPELTQGTDYRLFLQTFAGKGHVNAEAVLRGVEAIDAGESDFFQLTYVGVEEWEGRTLQFRINRVQIDGQTLATITRYDLTDTIELQRLRQEFSSSMISGQADERRRMARELHDSTAQLLTSVGLLLGTLKREPQSPNFHFLVDEMQELLGQAQHEIRSISYLAHAPAIEKMGLVEAVRVLGDGYGRRTQLDVSFEIHGAPIRLCPSVENALYRVAQESLSNVHRHARARHVRITAVFRRTITHLLIIDDGTGIPPEAIAGGKLAGVGLAGMRSRLAEIGGRLSVRRLAQGTAIIASVPADAFKTTKAATLASATASPKE